MVNKADDAGCAKPVGAGQQTHSAGPVQPL